MLNFDWLTDISLTGARILLIVCFLVALTFAMVTRKTYIFREAKNQKTWRDFRYWIIILVIVQVILYLTF